MSSSKEGEKLIKESGTVSQNIFFLFHYKSGNPPISPVVTSLCTANRYGSDSLIVPRNIVLLASLQFGVDITFFSTQNRFHITPLF